MVDSLKQSVNRLTGFQEAVLHTMYIWETGIAKHRKDEDAEVLFTSGFFTELLGVMWQGYHYDKMIELVDLGWVEMSKRNANTNVYSLTPRGRVALSAHCQQAARYTFNK